MTATTPYAPVDCPFCPHRVSLRHWIDHVAVTHPEHLARAAADLHQTITALRQEQQT